MGLKNSCLRPRNQVRPLTIFFFSALTEVTVEKGNQGVKGEPNPIISSIYVQLLLNRNIRDYTSVCPGNYISYIYFLQESPYHVRYLPSIQQHP
ncbi:hypothetical protein XENTR_v10020356 [Xenopus tropicalis]|nr:hypothetical protein XENTR_v10020356 [Xenopus tropicalis]